MLDDGGMEQSVFLDFDFFLLLIVSLVGPISTYVFMLRRKLVSRRIVLGFGTSLILMSGLTVFLLGLLGDQAKETPSKLDDKVFASEVSIALFLLPAVFAGIGTHIVSHVMIRHLDDAETRFESGH